jgi:hypothetical protein
MENTHDYVITSQDSISTFTNNILPDIKKPALNAGNDFIKKRFYQKSAKCIGDGRSSKSVSWIISIFI